MGESDTWECDDVVALKETELALLVDIDGDEHWVPKSVLADESEVHESGDEGTLVVAAWWARKEGLT